MEANVWSTVVAELSHPDVNICVNAAARLQAESIAGDIPKLLDLLKSNDFFVREAAAWPLAEHAGPRALVDLLHAYQRGFDEGHDNDGFTAALLEIPALHPKETRASLEQIVSTAEEPMRGHAEWLLGFCEPQRGSNDA
nr:HEAT repeat domain-containing protein [uncultured Rhodoferax sp.]